jgi:hypothetical protein
MESHTTGADAERALLRLLLATLAYRAAKTLRDAPPGFGDFASGGTTRTPRQIVAHMGDLMAWGLRTVEGEPKWSAEGGGDWDHEVRRFFQSLDAFDSAIASHGGGVSRLAELVQGPIADALTHVGQLAMLRAAAGAPVRPENYARADIAVGRVGLEQAAAVFEFQGDASTPRRRGGSG